MVDWYSCIPGPDYPSPCYLVVLYVLLIILLIITFFGNVIEAMQTAITLSSPYLSQIFIDIYFPELEMRAIIQCVSSASVTGESNVKV